MATAREIARQRFTADLLRTARDRLAVDGPAGLSLRAVARDLGVASSAVYRYVPSRDALLTMLVIEAYDDVGQVCEDAARRARAAGAAAPQVFLAVARAFRGWAMDQPHSYALVYGTPVPGYAAPQDTVPHALRLWGVVAGIVLEAGARGELRPTGPPFDEERLVEQAAVDVGRDVARTLGLEALAWGPREVTHTVSLFTALLGAVTAELFGHLRGAVTDHARAFDAVVATAASGAGLRVDLGI